jgi:hypothetical protein
MDVDAEATSDDSTSLYGGEAGHKRHRRISCSIKGKFCNIAGRPVNKGLGMLQMSSAKWRA